MRLSEDSQATQSGLERELVRLEAEVAEQRKLKESTVETGTRFREENKQISSDLNAANDKLATLKVR